MNNQKYVIMYQEDESDKVFSVFEDERWRPQVGASVSPGLTREAARSEARQAVKDGYRPTGDTTREILA